MKVRKQKSIPSAKRKFTDREEPRAAFWKNYDACKQNMSEPESEIRVLTYYGIGGIGKSRLLKQLMTEMDEKLAVPKYVFFDLAVHQESRAILEALKNKLSGAYGFTFPLFDLGVYNYARKIGEDTEAPEVKAYIDKSPFLSLLVSAAGKIPVVSIAAEVLSFADKSLAYARTYLVNHRSELVQIEYKEANELYDYLPYLFAQDMTRNLEGAKEPLVFLLDTFEQLVNEMPSVGEPLNNDLWLRGEDGLVQNIPYVLWVIGGREKLKWERFDPEWSSALEQHILGNLGPADSDSFLKNAGVGGAQLRQQLYQLTNGTPVYLDLCVDRFHDITEKGIVPTIESFGDNIYMLIERFVRYMDDSKKDMVYVLACMQQWNDDMITNIASSVLPGFSISTYERIKEFSFVIESDDFNYNLHQTVATVLLKNCPETLKLRTARCALEYVHKNLKNQMIFTNSYSSNLRHLIRFGLILYDGAELLKFYNEHISNRLKELNSSGKFAQAELLLEPVREKAEQNKDSMFYADVLFDRASMAREAGRYHEGLKLAEKTVELYKQLNVSNDAAKNLLALSLCDFDRYEEALKLQRQLLEKSRVIWGEEHLKTITSVNNLAITLGYLERYEEALEFQSQVLEKRQLILGEDHPETLIAINNLAITLGHLQRYEEALGLQRQLLEKSRVILGEEHPQTLATMSNLAFTLGRLGQHNKALELHEQVVEKCQELFGKEHPITKEAMYPLALTLEDIGRLEESVKLRIELL